MCAVEADFNTVAAIGGAIAALAGLIIFIFIIVAIVFVKYRSSRKVQKSHVSGLYNGCK